MPSISDLRKALAVSEKLEALKAELDALLGGGMSSSATPGKRRGRPPASTLDADSSEAGPVKKKRKMSAEGRARIIAAQKARWLKAKGDKASPLTEQPAKEKPANSKKKRAKKKAAKAAGK